MGGPLSFIVRNHLMMVKPKVHGAYTTNLTRGPCSKPCVLSVKPSLHPTVHGKLYQTLHGSLIFNIFS